MARSKLQRNLYFKSIPLDPLTSNLSILIPSVLSAKPKRQSSSWIQIRAAVVYKDTFRNSCGTANLKKCLKSDSLKILSRTSQNSRNNLKTFKIILKILKWSKKVKWSEKKLKLKYNYVWMFVLRLIWKISLKNCNEYICIRAFLIEIFRRKYIVMFIPEYYIFGD